MTPRTPAEEFLKDATVYKKFIRVLIGILLAISLTVLVTILMAPMLEANRLRGSFFMLSLLAFAWWRLNQHPRQATQVLVGGMWLQSCVASIQFAGVHSANLMVFPFLVALTGWALGARWLLGITCASVMLMAGLAVGELLGVYTPTPRAPVMVVLALHAGTLIACALLTHMAFTKLSASQQRLIDMSEQLSEHNLALALREAEVGELNDTLEQRVAERTADLATAMETLRNAQEDLLHSEAKAALGAMVASVTHELNTPLGNSVMAASTLNDQANIFLRNIEAGQLKRSELTAFLTSLRDGTNMIQRNLSRAETLLQNFKQVAADQTSEQRRQFDLAHTVGEVVAMLQPQLKRSPHRIEVLIPDGLVMDSYPGPLGQVLINLINNAYLHAFEGIAKGTLSINAEGTSENVTLHINDNGIGMTHDTLTRLFQPFFSTKTGKGGTGLGMTIVEGIVRKTLGGSLHVESEPGQGTRYSINLPRNAPDV